MEVIKNKTYDNERALYESCDLALEDCSFTGEADGESALKESKSISTSRCFFNLRYPFWHDDGALIDNCEMTVNCRAALWYSKNVKINNTKLHGIKALRECEGVSIDGCYVISSEFGWNNKEVKISNSTIQSEYFMMNSKELHLDNIKMEGKYSFQYIENATIENSELNTKDAFWHAKNVLVKNCIIKGEYLGWYCENVTFENCIITGTQPLCYCKGLKLINCQMHECDLSFEKSDVIAEITTPVISIKNVLSGKITVPGVDKIIKDKDAYKGLIEVKGR
ncbi:MAG: DUF3737 family protein [Clostridia bacterium]|nr:DUF3737 family protein [Clostridia bacterium]